MKPNAYIRTCNFILISGMFFSFVITGCEIKEDTPNTDKVYKAKPVNKVSDPPKEEQKKEEPKIDNSKPSLDSASIPSDSTNKVKKDTTETLNRQRKPPLRRYSQYNIHRRGYIT